MFFDTHAHYDDRRYDGERDNLLSGMKDMGVTGIVNVGADMKSSSASVALAEKYPFIYAAVGVHPHDAKTMNEQNIEILRSYLKHDKVKAVGEIGLDYHYDHSPRDIQKKWFIRQMELAREEGYPVVIHEREAVKDSVDIVKSFSDIKRGVFHCYSGSLETARELLKIGYYLSFTGVVTFKNARHSHEVIAYMPLDRLMIETDCPYLSPEPFRGQLNHSGRVYRVAEIISQIRGISTEKVAELTYNNAKEFFNI